MSDGASGTDRGARSACNYLWLSAHVDIHRFLFQPKAGAAGSWVATASGCSSTVLRQPGPHLTRQTRPRMLCPRMPASELCKAPLSLSLSLSLYLFLSLNSGPLGSNSHFMNTSWIVDILRNKKQRGEHMVKKLAVPLRHQAAHWPVDL